MWEEETLLCKEMKRIWRLSDGDEQLDKWKKCEGGKEEETKKKGRRTVTTLTASGLVDSFNLQDKFKCEDWLCSPRLVTAVAYMFVCLCIYFHQQLCRKKPAFRHEVNGSKRVIQPASLILLTPSLTRKLSTLPPTCCPLYKNVIFIKENSYEFTLKLSPTSIIFNLQYKTFQLILLLMSKCVIIF